MAFTAEQAAALNRWQHSGHVAPHTCPRPHPAAMVLVAGADGWSCPAAGCGFSDVGIPDRLTVPGLLSPEGVWTRRAG